MHHQAVALRQLNSQVALRMHLQMQEVAKVRHLLLLQALAPALGRVEIRS